MRGVLTAIGFLASVVLTGCASAQEVHPDYAFSATLPGGATRCSYDGRDADMGFLLLLDGKACSGDGSSDGFISVTYRPNVDAKQDIGDHYATVSFCRPGAEDADWHNAIDGLDTAVCRSMIGVDGDPEQLIGVAVSALGGARDAKGAPRFLYSIRLMSRANRFEQDLATFKRFLCSVDVIGEGFGSPLCAKPAS